MAYRMDKPTLILDWLLSLAHPECRDACKQPPAMDQICLFLVSQYALETMHLEQQDPHPLTRVVVVDKKKDVLTFTPALKEQWRGEILLGGGRNDDDALVGLTLPPVEERAHVEPFDMKNWAHVCYRARSGRQYSNVLDLTARRGKGKEEKS